MSPASRRGRVVRGAAAVPARAMSMIVTAAAVPRIVIAAAPAGAHEGSPSYRSEILQIRPSVNGLRAEVLNYDDRLALMNRTGETVLAKRYKGEAYIRIDADGTVEVNRRSPAYYLNEDRFAEVEVPSEASGSAKPRWQFVDRTGRYEWHDHRIHWMSKQLPRAVRDKDQRTKVFDWTVPLLVGDRSVELRGELFWEPSPSSVPSAAIVGFAGVVAASAALVTVARRRRARKSAVGPRSDAWG